MVEIHAPPNTHPVDEIYMFMSVDGGGEGIIAAPMGGILMTLVSSEQKIINRMMPIARELAARTGKTIKLVKFTAREDIMEIKP